MKNLSRILNIILLTITMLGTTTQCTFKTSADAAVGDAPDRNNDQYVFLYVSVDGKVCSLNSDGEAVPVADMSVTLSDALGNRIDSVRTTAFGRFLFEHDNVNVGFPRNQHIYIDIVDNRDSVATDQRFKPQHIIKEIIAAPDNIATLTLDEIILDLPQNIQ